MTAMEYVMTDEQFNMIQKWVADHDLTVKYVAVVLTVMLFLELLRTVGLVG